LKLTEGQASDIGQGEALIAGHEPEAVIADKGYDSNAFIGVIEERGAEAVIPPKSNRVEPREYDRHTYKERNLVERFWSFAKHYRRVATRYEKKGQNFLAFVYVSAIMILLQ
jgi:transposase